MGYIKQYWRERMGKEAALDTITGLTSVQEVKLEESLQSFLRDFEDWIDEIDLVISAAIKQKSFNWLTLLKKLFKRQVITFVDHEGKTMDNFDGALDLHKKSIDSEVEETREHTKQHGHFLFHFPPSEEEKMEDRALLCLGFLWRLHTRGVIRSGRKGMI